jgi:hypothetical protein
MALNISTQEVDTWKKRIQRDGLKGSTYFCQQGGLVWVSASADHQSICEGVLGKPTKDISLDSYIAWDDVQSNELVEIVYQIEMAPSDER